MYFEDNETTTEFFMHAPREREIFMKETEGNNFFLYHSLCVCVFFLNGDLKFPSGQTLHITFMQSIIQPVTESDISISRTHTQKLYIFVLRSRLSIIRLKVISPFSDFIYVTIYGDKFMLLLIHIR